MTILDFDMMSGIEKIQALSEKAIYLSQKKKTALKFHYIRLKIFKWRFIFIPLDTPIKVSAHLPTQENCGDILNK